MKKLNWSTIILDVIYIALGLVFVIHPTGVESVLCYILAAAVAVIGLLYLVGYFLQRADEHGYRTGNGFAFGILLIILAVFIISKQDLVIALVPFLFGVMVMIRGLMVIQSMFIIRRIGINILVPLITGLVTMGLGIFVMLFPFATMSALFILVGIGLLIGGLTGIAQEILVWQLHRRQAHEEERARDMEGARDVKSYPAANSEAPAKAGGDLVIEFEDDTDPAIPEETTARPAAAAAESVAPAAEPAAAEAVKAPAPAAAQAPKEPEA